MADSSEKGVLQENDAICSAICALMHKFRLTVCAGTTDFKSSFKSCLKKTAGLETLLDRSMETRLDMVAKSVAQVSAEEKLAAIDAYLPHLFTLSDSLIDKAAVQTDKELSYQWQGTLSRDLRFFKSHHLKFELLMVLETKVSISTFFLISITETFTM